MMARDVAYSPTLIERLLAETVQDIFDESGGYAGV
jgi:hypothetical protein